MDQRKQPNLNISNAKKNLGTGQILFGIAIILISILTGWLSVLLIGLVLIGWGITELSKFIIYKNVILSRWRFSVGALIFGTGLLLILFPGISAAALSLFLALLFVLSGFYKILAALNERSTNWGWEIFAAGLSIIIGLFVFSQWPLESYIILGILLGVDIIINGWSMLAISRITSKLIYNHRLFL